LLVAATFGLITAIVMAVGMLRPDVNKTDTDSPNPIDRPK
jgi:hypothetical protein